MKQLLYIAFIGLFFTACNLEKEVDIKLPEYEPEMVLECYLEAGKPYRATLLESASYFDAFDFDIFVEGATMNIFHNGDTIPLTEGLYFQGDKIFNFGSNQIVPEDYTNDFSIEIKDSIGRAIRATTRLLPPVPMDSVVWRFNSDTLGFILVHFNDNGSTTDFYRRTMYEENPDSGSVEDAFFDDVIINGEPVTIGSPPVYNMGDTVVVGLYHIDKAYYDFLVTTEAAFFGNLNPFAQPSAVKSNVEGGIGIFTGLSYVRDTVIVE